MLFMKENVQPQRVMGVQEQKLGSTAKEIQQCGLNIKGLSKEVGNLRVLQENFYKTTEVTVLDEAAKAEEKVYPVPKGNSPYCLGKKAEQIEQNLKKAKFFYEKAVQVKDRLPSAVKDLAGVLHSLNNTQQAINLLQKYEYLYYDKRKFNNLLESLKSQINPTGNAVNKIIKISNVSNQQNTKSFVQTIFPDQNRIVKVLNDTKNCCIFIYFNSHSGARKALTNFDGYQFPNLILEWSDAQGVIQGPVVLRRKNLNETDSPTQKELEGECDSKQDDQSPSLQSQNQELEIRNTSIKLKWHYLFAYQTNNFPFFLAVDQSCSLEDKKENIFQEQNYRLDYEKVMGTFVLNLI